MGYQRFTDVVGEDVSYDLVDLETVKDELGIAQDDTSRDVTLQREIVQVSALVQSYCGRIFVVEDIVDTFVREGWGGYRNGPLSLSRFPIANFRISPTTADTSSGLVLPIEDTSSAFDNTVISGLNIPAGTRVAEHQLTTVTLDHAISGAIPSGTMIAFGLVVTENPGLPGQSILQPVADYRIDPKAGLLHRMSCGCPCSWTGQSYSVRYSPGFVDVPGDITAAALRWITLRDQSRGDDPMLKSLEVPGVLSETKWVDSSAPGVPAEIQDMLTTYWVPRIG